MPSVILDGFGRPAQSPLTYGSIYSGSDTLDFKLARPDFSDDIRSLLPENKLRLARSDARYIHSAFPLVSGATRQRAQYVSASRWRPQFVGADAGWGKDAEALLTEANKLCDWRGTSYPFEKIWQIGCELWDTDGDWFFLLSSTEEGYPMFQCLEAHRIGQRENGETLVKEGPYKGARIQSGVIYNRVGTEVAYRVLGPTKDDDEDISARDLVRVASPRWFSEGRSLPSIAYSILDWYSISATRKAEQSAQLVNSMLTLIETNETGRRDLAREHVSGERTTDAGDPTGVIEKGLIRYVKSGKGKVEAFESNRPSDGWQKFDRTIIAGAFFGMDWRIEMMDLSLLGGAGVRGFQDNINTSILSRFLDLKPFALRATRYQVAKFIQRGDLKENADWWKFDFTAPPEFSVDPTRNVTSDIEALRAGIESEDNVIRRYFGTDPESFYRTRARTLKLKQRIAAEEGVEVADLGILTMPGDQANAQPAAQGQNDDQKN